MKAKIIAKFVSTKHIGYREEAGHKMVVSEVVVQYNDGTAQTIWITYGVDGVTPGTVHRSKPDGITTDESEE